MQPPDKCYSPWASHGTTTAAAPSRHPYSPGSCPHKHSACSQRAIGLWEPLSSSILKVILSKQYNRNKCFGDLSRTHETSSSNLVLFVYSPKTALEAHRTISAPSFRYRVEEFEHCSPLTLYVPLRQAAHYITSEACDNFSCFSYSTIPIKALLISGFYSVAFYFRSLKDSPQANKKHFSEVTVSRREKKKKPVLNYCCFNSCTKNKTQRLLQNSR